MVAAPESALDGGTSRIGFHADGISSSSTLGGWAAAASVTASVGVTFHGPSRADPAEQEQLPAEPDAWVLDLTGRPMKGWLLVDPVGPAEDVDLRRWVDRSVGYDRNLPPR